MQRLMRRVNSRCYKSMSNIDFVPGEVWKIAPEYSDYMVSSYGRIYSIRRKKVLRQYTNGYKYLFIKINKVNVRVHHLVAKAFIPNPEEKTVVHHLDGNSFNNRADNLMWCTTSEHMAIHWAIRKEKLKEKENNIE